jgi:CRISPR/Cas system-associated exonuclease Cas4 (RecB family)
MELSHVSASSVELFLNCKRKFFYAYCLGLKEPETKPQRFGKRLHASNERYFRGQVKELRGAILKSGLPLLPKPHDGLLVEQEIKLETYPGGPPWIGFIDLAEPPGPNTLATIRDYKTTSDLKYQKTPEELAVNVQMTAYGIWAVRTWNVSEVRLCHVSYQIPKKKAGNRYWKPPKAKLSEVVVSREHLEQRWAELMLVVREMVATARKWPATLGGAQKVEPTGAPKFCKAFGKACYHTERCGLSIITSIFSPSSEGFALRPEGTGSSSMSLKDKVNRKGKAVRSVTAGSASAEAASTPWTPDPSVPLETGVLPPDAPKSGGATAKERKAEQLEIGAKPVSTVVTASAAASSTPAAVVNSTPTVSDSPKDGSSDTTGSEELHLFIDCLPVKPHHTWTLLEDVVDPLMRNISEDAGVADWRLLSYSESNGRMAAVLRANVPKGIVVVNSMAPAAKLALEAWIPWAATVIRALKG